MTSHAADDEGVDLSVYWGIIRRKKKYILLFSSIVSIATIIASGFLPKYYKAEAVIMSISNKGSGLGALGGLAALAGVGATSSSNAQLMTLFQSRTMAEKVIQTFNLMAVLQPEPSANPLLDLENAVDTLRKSCVKFNEDKKTNAIIVTAEFKSPQLAADVANGYLQELQKFIAGNAFTSAKRNRIFVQNQLEEKKRELLNAGIELDQFYKSGKISSVASKIDVPIAQVVPNEESGDEMPIANLEEQFKTLHIVKDVPQQVYLQYLLLHRGLLTSTNTMLNQQYELAKIDEKKAELSFQVIDPARVPQKKSRPARSKIVLLAGFFSLFVGVGGAFVAEYLQKKRVECEFS